MYDLQQYSISTEMATLNSSSSTRKILVRNSAFLHTINLNIIIIQIEIASGSDELDTAFALDLTRFLEERQSRGVNVSWKWSPEVPSSHTPAVVHRCSCKLVRNDLHVGLEILIKP